MDPTPETYRIRQADGAAVEVSEDHFLEREGDLRACDSCGVYYPFSHEDGRTCDQCEADLCPECAEDRGILVYPECPDDDSPLWVCSPDCKTYLLEDLTDRDIQAAERRFPPGHFD